MLTLRFLGNAKDDFLAFPREVMRQAGRQLNRVQHGLEPSDWKPMPTIGAGVREIRLRDRAGIYRVVYVVKSRFGLLVLHAFVKKSQATSKRDIDLARQRLKDLA